ncbi:MAG: hypothetical protein WA765_09845 [Candidatus Acidiferrum sp.]
MLNSKTHFVQVPLEVVRKIVEEQAGMEPATEPYQEIEKKTLSEVLLETEAVSIALPVTLARMEPSN